MNFIKSVKPAECPLPIQIVAKMEACSRTNSRANIDPHQTVNRGITITKAYQCSHCCKSYEDKQQLVNHACTQFASAVEVDGNSQIRSRNQIEENPYHCRYCDRTFTRYESLERHLMVHAKEKSYQCCYCDKTFSNFSDSIDAHHINCKTRKNNIHIIECCVCDMYLSQGSAMSNHVRKQAGMKVDRKYHCSFCNRVFSKKSLLIIHSRKHNGEKPFQCNYCGKRFTENSNLKRHLKIHTGERQFQCSYCGKAFSQNGDLKKHIMTHTGEKPHKCSYCKKAFTEKRTLVTHYRTHTGEKPYQCIHCNKAFTQKGNLTYHMRTHFIMNNETECTENSETIHYDMNSFKSRNQVTQAIDDTNSFKAHNQVTQAIDDTNSFKAHNQVTQAIDETYTPPSSLNISNKTFSNSRIDIISEMAYAAACMAEQVNPNKFRRVMDQYFMTNNLPIINKSVSDKDIKKIYYSENFATNTKNTTSMAVALLPEESTSINKESLAENSNNSSSINVSELLEESLLINPEDLPQNLPLNASLNHTPSITVSVAQDEPRLENATVLSISDMHFSSDIIEIQI